MSSSTANGDAYLLSVVIPARNEARRLPATLAALARWTSTAGLACEAIVVDDRSLDATAEVARAARDLPVRVLALAAGEGGVGTAVRAGIAAARGERILICDADGSVPFACLSVLGAALDAGCDVAAGSRCLDPASILVPQPWYRVRMGQAWRWLVRGLAPTGVRDTQCGFKLIGRSAALALAQRCRCQSFAFHVELLLLARKLGLGIIEVPVQWRDQPDSKVRLVGDSLAMGAELIGLVWRTRHLRPDPGVTTTRVEAGRTSFSPQRVSQ